MAERAAEAPAVELRPAQRGDAAALARLAGVLGYPATEQDLDERLRLLDAAAHAVVVAELDGRVVGWIHAAAMTSLESGRCVEIVGLVVSPECRRRGIARRLVDSACVWARERGVSRVRVRTRVQREDAQRFYEAAGFARVKTQHVYERS